MLEGALVRDAKVLRTVESHSLSRVLDTEPHEEHGKQIISHVGS